MHTSEASSAPAAEVDDGRPWWKLLTRYHWFVFIVASLGWLFDTMDQQLFNIARNPAMRALAPDSVAQSSGALTSLFLIGWGTGGLTFRALADLLCRGPPMVITLLPFSVSP